MLKIITYVLPIVCFASITTLNNLQSLIHWGIVSETCCWRRPEASGLYNWFISLLVFIMPVILTVLKCLYQKNLCSDTQNWQQDLCFSCFHSHSDDHKADKTTGHQTSQALYVLVTSSKNIQHVCSYTLLSCSLTPPKFSKHLFPPLRYFFLHCKRKIYYLHSVLKMWKFPHWWGRYLYESAAMHFRACVSLANFIYWCVFLRDG